MRYTAAVSGAARDTAGATLLDPTTWSFTTGASTAGASAAGVTTLRRRGP